MIPWKCSMKNKESVESWKLMQEISLGNDEISKSLKQAAEHQKAMKNASLSFKEKKAGV